MKQNQDEDPWAKDYSEVVISSYEELDDNGEEDEDLYVAAIIRARVGLAEGAPQHTDRSFDREYQNLVIQQDENLVIHPLSAIWTALGVPTKNFSPGLHVWRRTGIHSADGQTLQSTGYLMQTEVAQAEGHIAVAHGGAEWAPMTLARNIYLCWRAGALPHRPASGLGSVWTYRPNQIPAFPKITLEYITFYDITDLKTLSLLNRVSELPGHRIQNYQDPNLNPNVNAYYFNIDLLNKNHETSRERWYTDLLLGSTEATAVRMMLQYFPQGLAGATIQFIAFVLDHDTAAKAPSATIIIGLRPQSSMPNFLEIPGLERPRWPRSNDPRLIVSEHRGGKFDIEQHPLRPKSRPGGWGSNAASYIRVSIGYLVDSGTNFLEIGLSYSKLERHLIVHNIQQLTPAVLAQVASLSTSSPLAKILLSAWFHLAGVAPLEAITFLDMAGPAAALITQGIIGTKPGAVSVIDILTEEGSRQLETIGSQLAATQSLEVITLKEMLDDGAHIFGEYQLVRLLFEQHRTHGTCLVVYVVYALSKSVARERQSLGQSTRDPVEQALERGIHMRTWMETLEIRFLEDKAGFESQLRQFDPMERQEFIDTDKTFAEKHIKQFSFQPPLSKKPCNVVDAPDFIKEIQNWADDSDPSSSRNGGDEHDRSSALDLDRMQSRWREKIGFDFTNNGELTMCEYNLTKLPSKNPKIPDFSLTIDQARGHIAVNTKLADWEYDMGATEFARLADAIWALWIGAYDPMSFGLDSLEATRAGHTGLRYVTILQPSNQTKLVLKRLYDHYKLSTDKILIFADTESGFTLVSDRPRRKESIYRRLLLTLHGLTEVYIIDYLCRMTFGEPYSVLNYRRRVGAILIRWKKDLPELFIGLGDYTFENNARDDRDFKAVKAIRGSGSLLQSTMTGLAIAWSSASQHEHEIPQPAAAQGEPEFEFQAANSLEGSPPEIQNFIQSRPWSDNDDPADPKYLTRREQLDIHQLVHVSRSVMGSLFYSYSHRYSTSIYEFNVLQSPYQVIVKIRNDGEDGRPSDPSWVGIERLSRAYYDLFMKTLQQRVTDDSETCWISMQGYQISLRTSSDIRRLWQLLSIRIPGFTSIDVSFEAMLNPTSEYKENIQIGKTLLGLVEIAALGRMLFDHALSMRDLKIARILIDKAQGPEDQGAAHSDFQILVMLRPQKYSN
ncbi:hypothetical protein TWF696_003090 [Orbilia brochopaga]|uniref:Uncharacterized protein n=1 Tax=Orbilia brochopaga TaxID=3140254 RepID=A0AAV9U360_9PEZI